MMRRVLVTLSVILFLGACMQSKTDQLSPAPERIDIFGEIGVMYPKKLAKLFNDLTPQERIFIYYLHRACLPGNRIASDQSHRHANQITTMLEALLEKKDLLKEKQSKESVLSGVDLDLFLRDVTTYLTYLWTCHSQYFLREHQDEKRTPSSIGLKQLTQNNLVSALQVIDFQDAQKAVEEVARSLFEKSYESTLAVPGDIEKSAVNLYSSDFTEQHFSELDPEDQKQINSRGYLKEVKGKKVPAIEVYKVGGRFGKEMEVMVHWLEKAREIAKKYPEQFDKHVVKSLKYLCEYLRTGDEQLFKEHSKEWLKTKSRVDFTLGFIETYEDPKSYRGTFEADVTIKSIDMASLNKLLPKLEDTLPFDPAFKRENLYDETAIPNASINVKAFTAGFLGPINMILAYCLPNYEEIRSQHGSKQIIYEPEKAIGEMVNPELYHQLFNSKERLAWHKKYDPDFALHRDLFSLLVILHETLGHGSGRVTEHTFKEGDDLTIEGKTYNIGDTIPVTSGNIQQFLMGYDQTLEELRAEVIALLSSIICYDDFAQSGSLKEWPKKISKEKMIELLIHEMMRSGLNRLMSQPDDATEVTGDHARADTTILNYILDHGTGYIVEEDIEVDGKKYTVLDVGFKDQSKAIEAVKKLATEVQRIKSTGDGVAVRKLIGTYGSVLRNPEYIAILKKNREAATGGIKLTTMIYPNYVLVKDSAGNVLDVKATWPNSFAEQQLALKKLAISTS